MRQLVGQTIKLITKLIIWSIIRETPALMAPIELTETNTYDELARSVNNQAYYVASVLRTFDLKPDNAEFDEIGTI